MGYKTIVRHISRGEVYISDEIFLTGTAAEITPITKIDHKKVGSGKPGPITKKIMKTYDDLVMNRNEKYSGWLTPVY